ncbi:MAG: class I SAM-dependent methyltransferase [Thermomicrobiales bacterium]
MSNQQQENLVQWVYAAKTPEELSERYDTWAATYEEDLDRDFGWYGPMHAVNAALKYISKDARILDAGAGTGLVGTLLDEHGYDEIVGIDMSRGMLEQAAQKDVYDELHRMVMGEPLDFETNAFDAAMSVGVLTVSHAPVESLDELVRVTRPGGHIIYTLRPDLYEEGGFKEKQEALISSGAWQLAEVSEPLQILPKGEPDVYHQVWVHEVTG